MSYKIKISGVEPLLKTAFDNFRYEHYNPASVIKITETLLVNYNIKLISNSIHNWDDDDLIFPSQEDCFLFLLEWS